MQTADPFPAGDFDQWADSYDEDVARYDRFPFAGYDRVLAAVVREASPRKGMRVLDIGIGTGNLAKRFADAECEVWGMDYSPAMLEKARQKLPQATLVSHDLRHRWPAELEGRFNLIVSAYTFHHFELDRKVKLISELCRERLEEEGRIVIADVSFASLDEMRAFAAAIGDEWEEEPYWLANDAAKALTTAGLHCAYQQVSACAGVYRIEQA